MDKKLSGPNFVVLGPNDFPDSGPNSRIPIFHISDPKIAALGPNQQAKKILIIIFSLNRDPNCLFLGPKSSSAKSNFQEKSTK
jgi:hypothetical protein